MEHKNAKRDISILLKVTPQEKEQIIKNAAAFGGSLSEFIRHQSLHPDDSSTNGTQTQSIVRELCRLSEDVKKSVMQNRGIISKKGSKTYGYL